MLVLVPAGEFVMGREDGPPDERPAHRVKVPAFYIGRFEVTNAQFRRFLAESGRPAPEGWKREAERWGEQAPALSLSFRDARAYCDWAGLRLPSEAEWERAARGQDSRPYPWGDRFEAARCRSSADGPCPVGSFPEGASPFGCLDMAGNAWEWTDSWYRPYPGSRDVSEPYGEKFRVLRGGCYQHRSPDFLATTHRGFNLEVARYNPTGFRVARSLP
ncbi:MAG: SUMF1/EgtB/PvdO family nonheme iron enzyme [Candidatus Eremiobacterota bacterium]